MLKNVLIVDVETNGLDPAVSDVIELGAVLYSVEHQTTLAQVSSIAIGRTNDLEHLNGIPAAALENGALTLSVKESIESVLDAMEKEADAVVAHHCEFDRQFLPKLKGPWICSCFDLEWPKSHVNGSSLVSVALAHGIGVTQAHRALPDCQLIAALFDRMEDLQGMLEQALRPKAIFRALVSFEEKDLAKDAGFKWNPEAKLWTRRMFVEDVDDLPFDTVKIADC